MRSPQRHAFLPIMLLTGLWMTGCAGSQKPKMAPANTALGTMQRAEVKLKAGQKAQAEQKYTVALEQHLDAIKMAESISTKYPKDPVTTTFQTKPMLGKTSLDALKTETIPTLRQQSMISKDLLGWALVEIEQIKPDRKRQNQYKRLFNALYYSGDYDNAERLVEVVKDDVSEKQLARMKKQLDKAKAKTPKRTNSTKLYSKVLTAAALLEQQKLDEYLALIDKETDADAKRAMYSAILDYVRLNPDRPLTTDKATLKKVLTSSFWERLQPKRSFFSTFSMRRVSKRHSSFGFDSSEAMVDHLLDHTNKQPISYKRAMAKLQLARLRNKKDTDKIRSLFMSAAQDILTLAKQNPDVPSSLVSQNIYGLKSKKILTKETFAVIEKLAALPNKLSSISQQRRERDIMTMRSILGLSVPNTTLAPLPKVESDKDLNYRNRGALTRAMRTYTEAAAAYGKANQTAELKALLKTLKASAAALNTLLSSTKKPKDVQALLNTNQRVQLAAHLALKDEKAILKTLDEITKAPKPSYFVHPSNAVLDDYATNGGLSAKKQAVLDEKLIQLLKLNTYGYSMARQFPLWLTKQIKDKQIKTLEKVISNLANARSKKRVLDSLAQLYVQMDTPPSDDTVAKWIVSQSAAIKVKKFGTPEVTYIAQMCQRPEAKCQPQFKAIMEDASLSDYARRRAVERLARSKQIDLAKTYLPTIKDPATQALTKLAILERELYQHQNFSKIKPELNQIIEAIGKLPKNEQRRRLRTVYYIYNNRCHELDAMLKARKEEGLDTYSAVTNCARGSYSISTPSSLAVLSMLQRVSKPSNRFDVLIRVIERRGVVQTPAIQKVLLDTASKWKEINKPDETTPMTKRTY